MDKCLLCKFPTKTEDAVNFNEQRKKRFIEICQEYDLNIHNSRGFKNLSTRVVHQVCFKSLTNPKCKKKWTRVQEVDKSSASNNVQKDPAISPNRNDSDDSSEFNEVYTIYI